MPTENEPIKLSRKRRYRIWLSYTVEDSAAGRRQLEQEVIADQAVRAMEEVLTRNQGIDIVVATIEQMAVVDAAITAEN